MSIVSLLDRELGRIRVTPAQRGQMVTFERHGRWRTMHVIEQPHFEVSLPVPELAMLEMSLRFGVKTLLGVPSPDRDPTWLLRTNAAGITRAMLADPSWLPRPPRDLRRELLTAGRHAALVAAAYLTYGLIHPPAHLDDPVPRYALDIADGTATIQRQAGEFDPARCLAMVRRLVQIATWPDRALAALRDLARALDGVVRGDTWAPAQTAVELERGPVAIRIDHALTKGALHTRITARGHAEAVAYLDGVVAEVAPVARAIDELVGQVAPATSAGGPYR